MHPFYRQHEILIFNDTDADANIRRPIHSQVET